MKRSELKRYTELKPGTPLAPGSGLRRKTPMARSALSSSPSARSSTSKSAPRRSQPMFADNPSPEVVEAVVDRDRLSCVRCGYGVGPHERGRRWSLHHRKLRSQGGEHTPQNLILLCGGSEAPGCHGWVHEHSNRAREEGGWILKRRDEPLAKPVYIPLEDRWVWLGADGLYRDVPKEAS